MDQTVTIKPAALENVIASALEAANTSRANARATAAFLTLAEIDGQKGHGLARVPSYAAQAVSGKVDGHAIPELTQSRAASIMIDARNGFAYPALQLARDALPGLAAETGIAAAAITRSHHAGALGGQVEALAHGGLIAIAFANTPKAMAPWGGNSAIFGTNPIAFAAPRGPGPATSADAAQSAAGTMFPCSALPSDWRQQEGAPLPLVIDLSLSQAARGKIMLAAQNDEPIPEGWALDERGAPTTDPHAAMAGTLLPLGGAKGAALAMMVEVMAAALTGANFAFEASSFFAGEGPAPAVGQFLMVVDPAAFSGAEVFAARFEALARMIEADGDARLPGSRRAQRRATAIRDGVGVDQELFHRVEKLAGGTIEPPDA